MSPFAPFFHTNYVPSDAELGEINLIITEAESKLSKLVEEIAKQPSKSFFEKRDALQEFINSHRALTSPIRRLPFDIIRNIFLLCRPIETDRIMKATDAPVLITHVCSHWRSVALTVPHLWTTIYIDKPKEKYSYQLAWKFLERSRDLPLTFTMRLEQKISQSDQDFLSLLSHSAHRWRMLHITGPKWAIIPFPVDVSPILDALSFDCSEYPAYWLQAEEESDFFKSNIFKANNVQHLFLRISFIGFTSGSFPSFFPHLTDLVLDGTTRAPGKHLYLSVSKAFLILSRCPRLIRCSLWIATSTFKSDGFAAHVMSSQPISLPLLEYLFVFDAFAEAKGLFQLLELPALRRVEFHSATQATHLERSPLLYLIKHWGQRVEELVVDPAYFAKYDLWQCFRLLPSLRHLTINHNIVPYTNFQEDDWLRSAPANCFDDADIKILTPSATTPVICPKLQVFSCSHHRITRPALKNFIAARRAMSGVEPLWKVVISPPPGPQELLPPL